MTKFITLMIGLSLGLAAVAQAKPAQEENPKNKKSQPAQKQQQVAPKQQQVAPKQHKAPNPQVQAMPKQQHKAPNPQVQAKPNTKGPAQQRYADVPPDNTVVKPNKPVVKANKPTKDGSLADGRYTLTAPASSKKPKGTNQNLTTLPPDNTVVKPNKPLVQPNTLPAVQAEKLKVNKTVKTFQPRHRNFQAKVNPSVASVRFNENFRIRNAENWRGNHYNVFRTYRPQWHDRGWWHSHHNHITLIGGGWYFWNAGYWYPAWGYDDSAAYYPYDGPIYVGESPRPFDQIVADVQSILQEQGYYRGEVDGLVGPLTQEALAAYQSAQGLESTAAIDQPTLESLGIS